MTGNGCKLPTVEKERVKFPVRVGLLGCGTVGGGVIRLIQENSEYLASRVGAPLSITHVLVRDAVKDRVAECRREWITTDPEAVLGQDVDLVVEPHMYHDWLTVLPNGVSSMLTVERGLASSL